MEELSPLEIEMHLLDAYLGLFFVAFISSVWCVTKFRKKFPFFELTIRNKWWFIGNILYWFGFVFCFLGSITAGAMVYGPGADSYWQDMEIQELHDNGTWTQEKEDSIVAKYDSIRDIEFREIEDYNEDTTKIEEDSVINQE